eukprot:TRINITY_DN51603_c0_g1_i1.p1 TRINITY_DN51603_c0_g1~~TRINITY_DN51603_c0_g1_i1.p1  ORF type:complete len:289 (+),score=41.21 TRINITY_DN51603_c0_g1_i1:84-950(+)
MASKGACLDCGALLKTIEYNNEFVVGCLDCWEQVECQGPPPCNKGKSAAQLKMDAAADRMKKIQAQMAKEYEENNNIRDGKKKVRLDNLMKKEPLKKALHSMIRHIQARNLSEVELFNEIDDNGDGVLSRGEMQAGLRKIGCNLAASELDAVVRSLDVDGSGFVDFGEFYELIKQEMEKIGGLEIAGPDPRMMGFEINQRIRLTVQLWIESERKQPGETGDVEPIEVGTVMGPGRKPGTLTVKLDRSGESYNLRHDHIVPHNATKLPQHDFFCTCDKCNEPEWYKDDD